MLNSRSRRLTIALAAGALTVFGATGAFAAGDTQPSDESNPLCAGTPLAATPICTPPSEPPGEGGGGGGGDTGPGGGSGGGSPSLSPADEGANPVCLLMPADPSCQPSQGPGGGDGGGGDTQPSPGGPGGGGDGGGGGFDS
jgi:hypothetical protein